MGCDDQLESRGFFTRECPGIIWVKCLEIFPAKVHLGRSFRGVFFYFENFGESPGNCRDAYPILHAGSQVYSCSGYDLDHQV